MNNAAGAMAQNERRVTQFEEQINDMQNNITGLEDMVEQLCGRLSCAARSEQPLGPGSVSGVAPVPPPLVALANEVATCSERVAVARRRLGSLLDRLEI